LSRSNFFAVGEEVVDKVAEALVAYQSSHQETHNNYFRPCLGQHEDKYTSAPATNKKG
jgi:hypothetical protein